MSSYASISIDRRAEYYARCAQVIAADPLDFYTRAERGRRFQASRLTLRSELPASAAPLQAVQACGTELKLASSNSADTVQRFSRNALAA